VPQIGPSIPLWTFCAVLLALTVKHYAADFVLQTNWMARGKEKLQGWPLPLAVHVLCHAGLVLGLTLLIAPHLWWLAIADAAIHGSIDRCKSLLSHWGGWGTTQAPFWWLLGGDQFLHQVTNVGLAVAFFIL
jgi:hypothetical protein